MDENLLQNKTILVVDDETDLRNILASEFDFMGAKVYQADNITNAQKIIVENKIDLIVSDIRMPGGTGIDLLDILKNKNVTEPPIILITGFADITPEDAFAKGAEALISKPFQLDDLIQQTVRYTSPMELRFSEKSIGTFEFKKDYSGTFDEQVKARKFLLGRGGIATCMELKGKKCDIGEIINFNFKFQDAHLEGVGVCRWSRLYEQAEGVNCIGFEFLYLDDKTLEFLRAFLKREETRAFIPALSPI